MTPPRFSIYNTEKKVNYGLIEGYSFPSLPDAVGAEVDVAPNDRPKVAKAVLTCNDDHATVTTGKPWRIKQVKLWKHNLFAATLMDAKGKVLFQGAVKFIVANLPEAPTQPTDQPHAPDGEITSRRGKGICCYDSDDIAKCTPYLKDLGVDRIRTWNQFPDHKWTISAGTVANFVAWHAAGFTPMPTITSTAIPTLADAKEFWKRNAGALAGKVARVHANNEVNLSNYFSGTLQQAFDLIAAPAAEALHAVGIKFVAPSISEHPEVWDAWLKTGIADVADYLSTDPYGADSTDQHKNRIDPIIRLIGGRKPLIAPEFNLHSAREGGWAVELPKAWDYASQYLQEIFYYRLFTNKQYAGMRGVLEKDYSKNQPEYDIVKGLKV
jgi:hypothetical protein